METIKRLVTITVAFLFCLVPLAVIAYSAESEPFCDQTKNPFSDVSVDTKYGNDICKVYEYGIMNGKPGGLFDPDSYITSHQLITVSARLHAWINQISYDFSAKESSHWYLPYIEYCQKAGICFDEPINENEMATWSEVLSVLYQTLSFQNSNRSEKSMPNGSEPDVILQYNFDELVSIDESLHFESDDYVLRNEFAMVISSVINKYAQQLMTNLIFELSSSKIGDTFSFGRYEQDNNFSNGKEEIEWIVLKKEDNRVLAISKFALDCVKYNTEENITENCPYSFVLDWRKYNTEENITETSILEYVEWCTAWDSSALNKWLNNDFVMEAFNSSEYQVIDKDSHDEVVFLLNEDEVAECFKFPNERACSPTKYAVARGVFLYLPGKYSKYNDKTKDSRPSCSWWLKPKSEDNNGWLVVPAVHFDGEIYHYNVDYDYVGVRPVVWIHLYN